MDLFDPDRAQRHELLDSLVDLASGIGLGGYPLISLVILIPDGVLWVEHGIARVRRPRDTDRPDQPVRGSSQQALPTRRRYAFVWGAIDVVVEFYDPSIGVDSGISAPTIAIDTSISALSDTMYEPSSRSLPVDARGVL